jgi:phosphoribosylformylglycinamidine cyclo-ligase
MKKTFNMGIGYIMVVDIKDSEIVIDTLKNSGFDAYQIGLIEQGNKRIRYV